MSDCSLFYVEVEVYLEMVLEEEVFQFLEDYLELNSFEEKFVEVLEFFDLDINFEFLEFVLEFDFGFDIDVFGEVDYSFESDMFVVGVGEEFNFLMVDELNGQEMDIEVWKNQELQVLEFVLNEVILDGVVYFELEELYFSGIVEE